MSDTAVTTLPSGGAAHQEQSKSAQEKQEHEAEKGPDAEKSMTNTSGAKRAALMPVRVFPGLQPTSGITVVYWGGILISVVHQILASIFYSYVDVIEKHEYRFTESYSSNVCMSVFCVFTFIVNLVMCCKYGSHSTTTMIQMDTCPIPWSLASSILYVVVSLTQAIVVTLLIGEMYNTSYPLASHKAYASGFVTVSWIIMFAGYIFALVNGWFIYVAIVFRIAANSRETARLNMMMTRNAGGPYPYAGAVTVQHGGTMVVAAPPYSPYGGYGTPYYNNPYGPARY